MQPQPIAASLDPVGAKQEEPAVSGNKLNSPLCSFFLRTWLLFDDGASVVVVSGIPHCVRHNKRSRCVKQWPRERSDSLGRLEPKKDTLAEKNRD